MKPRTHGIPSPFTTLSPGPLPRTTDHGYPHKGSEDRRGDVLDLYVRAHVPEGWWRGRPYLYRLDRVVHHFVLDGSLLPGPLRDYDPRLQGLGLGDGRDGGVRGDGDGWVGGRGKVVDLKSVSDSKPPSLLLPGGPMGLGDRGPVPRGKGSDRFFLDLEYEDLLSDDGDRRLGEDRWYRGLRRFRSSAASSKSYLLPLHDTGTDGDTVPCPRPDPRPSRSPWREGGKSDVTHTSSVDGTEGGGATGDKPESRTDRRTPQSSSWGSRREN